MKPKYTASALRNNKFGASLATIVTVCFSTAGMTFAADWVGTTSTDWNNNANWAGGAGTGGSNAIVNTVTPNIATISANIAATPVDIFVGNEAGNTGRLDHTAGTAQTGGANWMYIGRRGGNGTYNIANPAGTGGTFTSMGQGTGSITIGGRLYVGGWEVQNGVAKMNVNTTGTVRVNTWLQVGVAGSTGELNIDSGTVDMGTVGGEAWFEVGNGILNDVKSVGTFRMSGGTLTKVGSQHWSIGTNGGIGKARITGGNITINNEIWVGQITGAVAAVQQASEGELEITGGTLTNNSWVAIGRQGGHGIVKMSGGTWNKNGNSNFIIGASQGNGVRGIGTLELSGGSITVAPSVEANRGLTWVAEQDNSEGHFTLSGTATFQTPRLIVAPNTGATGTVDLDGGTLRVGQFIGGGGAETIAFNGTQIIATMPNQTQFLEAHDTAVIEAGGLKIDSNGNNLVAAQVLSGSGPITKSGAGKLVLSGANTASGAISVTGGTLISNTAATGGGNFTVANGAGMGVLQTAPAATLTVANIAMGTSAATSIDIDLGNIAANPTVAPLTVGAISLAGTVTVNVADSLPATGTFPLIKYTTKTGAGSFTLGTLPLGVVATLSESGGTVSLNVSSVKMPRWTGAVDGIWSATSNTNNWIDLVSNSPTAYTDPAPVLFDDNATGTTTVNIQGTVAPSKVTFSNTANPADPGPVGKNYTLEGTGKITGSTGLTKVGGGNLTVNTANDYTGPTTFDGGQVSINSIANAGAASSIGAAAVDASNLILKATTLTYTGAAATTDRGFTIGGTGTVISNANDITFGGLVATSEGNLTKRGAGNLTLSNPGANVIGSVNQGLKVEGGTMTFQGSGTQTNAVFGEIWIASVADVPAHVVLNGGALNATSWLALGRGNGNAQSSITATNSTIQTSNFSTGFANGLPNDSDQTVSLNNTVWTNNGATLLAESENANTTFTLSGTTQFNATAVNEGGRSHFALGTNSVVNMTLSGSAKYTAKGRFQIAHGTGSSATITVENNAGIVKTGEWTSIGNSNNGVGTLNVKNNGTFSTDGDFNISDVGTSTGFVNVSDSGAVTSSGAAYIGKGGGTSGTVTMTGGSFTVSNQINVASGITGEGVRSLGVVNVNGGSFNQTGAGQGLTVGGAGTGTLNITAGAVNVSGSQGLVLGDTGTGTVNLDGGTLTTTRVWGGAAGGSGTFNFDGGALLVGAGANADFFNGVENVVVEAGGAIINSNGNDATINQSFGGVGGLTKTGAGTLILNGNISVQGDTVVSAGTLAGSAVFTGNITVNSGANLSPGAPNGTLSTSDGKITFNAGASLTIDLTGGDDFISSPELALNNTTLVLNGAPSQPVHLIARVGTVTGTFGTPAPSGYSYNYAYEVDGTPFVALVQTGGASPYTTWVNGFFPGVTDPAIVGENADPDGDGNSNILEFALGGAPNSSTNNPKVYSLLADGSVDEDTNRELLLTIAVRSGTPVFSGTPSPTATHEGAVYTVQGSMDLSGFATGVTVVAPVAPASAPTAPTGYEYRTFSLNGSNNLTGKGFLRARVNKAP